MDNIGLFPLSIVLFPESYYPLHIFEERYKNLINDCVDQNTDFGINLVISSKIYDIGCTAAVVDVINEYEDGKMDITVQGVDRFMIKNMKISDRLYNTAEVDYFDDDDKNDELPQDEENMLLQECIGYYNTIADIVQSLAIKKMDVNNLKTKRPSFIIARKSGMSLKQKQELLEMKSENKRLMTLRKHLKEILPLLKNAEMINRVIKNDGYFKPEYL